MRSTRSRSRARGAHGSSVVFGIAGLALAALALVPASSPAQTLQTGTLTGKVSDNTGARAPGVTVTLSSPVLLTSRTSTTDGEGAYRFAALPPGTYSLTLELQGFRKLTRRTCSWTWGPPAPSTSPSRWGPWETIEVVGGPRRWTSPRRTSPRASTPTPCSRSRPRATCGPSSRTSRPRSCSTARTWAAARVGCKPCSRPRQHLASEHLRAERGQRHRPCGHGRRRLLLRLRQLRAGAGLDRPALSRGGHARRLLQLRGQAGRRFLPRGRRLLLRERAAW